MAVVLDSTKNLLCQADKEKKKYFIKDSNLLLNHNYYQLHSNTKTKPAVS